jgi:adenylate cyclase
MLPCRYLKSVSEDASSDRFPFHERLQVGRLQASEPLPGHMQVDDPSVSSRHCIITQNPQGKCFIRDVSRNGTRLDGRRLVPNLESELLPGQVLAIGQFLKLVLDGEESAIDSLASVAYGGTILSVAPTIVTVLVGDIRNYSVLVRKSVSISLQQSVARVFEVLSHAVGRLGGTVKEYQGDAIFAFWEPTMDREPAVSACTAALELNDLVRRIAKDKSIWDVPDHDLEMDWALATGPVVIDTFGSGQAAALSMVGEPVVLAFRIEKFADAESGPIVACDRTRERAETVFKFRALGLKQVKGFDESQQIHALMYANPSDT